MSFETVTIGPCTLIRGDCLEVLPTLRGVDAVVTDPPYGVELTERVTKHTRRSASTQYQDDGRFIRREIIPRVIDAITIAPVAAVTPGNRWLQNYPLANDIGTVFFPNGAGCSPWGFNCNNPILYYGKCPYLAAGMGSRPNSVSATHWLSGDVDHPCPKPVEFMEWLVRRTTIERDAMVCDPFMGSGTTGVACIKTGRQFIGIELEQKYFDIACERIRKAWKLERSKLNLDPPVRMTQRELIGA